MVLKIQVLLHGGLMTIGEMSTLLEPFAKTHKVIALELHGHGRTADTDRPITFEAIEKYLADPLTNPPGGAAAASQAAPAKPKPEQ